MWENMNGEWIWMDKEMGADEYARQMAEQRAARYIGGRCAAAGRELGAADIALGVAGGMVAAKAASRVGSWLAWVAVLGVVAMVLL